MLRIAGWNYSRAISKIDHCVFGLQPSVMQKMQADAGQNAFNSQVSTHAKLFQVTALCEYWQRNMRLTRAHLLNGRDPRYEIEKSIKQLSQNTDGPSCQKLIVPLQSYRSELLLTLFYKMISTVRKSKVPRNKKYLYKTAY